MTISELIDLWMEQHTPTWSPSTMANHKSRVARVKADPIAKVRLARLSAVDVDRWHARWARNGVGDGSSGNRHQALRAAVPQAVRWVLAPDRLLGSARSRQAPKVRQSLPGVG